MEFSAEQEGSLESVESFRPGFGGDASNFAVAASRAGARVGMVARIGKDRFGDGLMALWEREGVNAEHVLRGGGPTGVYFISREEGRHEFTYYRSGSAASRMTPELLPADAIREAGVLHVTGITQGISDSSCDAAFAAMDIARQAGTLVSYDPNYRPALWSAQRAAGIIKESVSRADFVFPSLEETELLFGICDPEDAIDRYLGLGAKKVILKLGKDGAIFADGGGLVRVSPMRVRVVDSSGAGDTLAGAFVAAYMENRSPEACTRFAVAASGLSTTGVGCVRPMPGREDILRRMAPDTL